MRNKLYLTSYIFFIAIIFLIGISVRNNYFDKNEIADVSGQSEFLTCLNKDDESEKLDVKTSFYIKELDKYLSRYNVSVKYLNLATNFSYDYNEDHDYYAASTIKILDALYLFDKASNSEIDLDNTIKYTSNYMFSDSKGLKNHNIGEEIPIRKLIEYDIVYSDNSAHHMLVDFIGFDNLKEYGNKLGAKTTLNGDDYFGNINTNDAAIYLKKAYEFIQNNKELGEEFNNYLKNAENNCLQLLDLSTAHKYGYYNEYFHDIGIVYDEYPYIIVVLSEEGNNDYNAIINGISKRINQLHKLYMNNKIKTCKN